MALNGHAVEPMERRPLPRVSATCDYCGSSDTRPETGLLRDEEGQESLPEHFRAETFRFMRCVSCGLVYLRERPHLDDLDVYYGQDYKCFRSYSERGAILQYLAHTLARAKLREIQKLMPAGSNTLLDYGCGSGTWLNLLRQAGAPPTLRMIGTDVTAGAIETARASGLEAYVCDEETLARHVEPGSVGVVYNFHVIEHVPSPKRMLERLRDVLAPGGILLGQTPNIASMGRKVWGNTWNQWHAPRHFVLFDHETLVRHAEAAGYEVLAVRNSLSGATQWAQSALSWLAQRGARPFRGIDEPLYAPLLLAFLPVVALESLFGRTCHMDFVLRKSP
jgi:2-polyprenyl-3-methyl-5-hydroxy-6-metoxy-1,4-benzoquinol methylase